MPRRQIILNGELIFADAARVTPLSDGFMYGLGLFETLKVMDGMPVFFSEHFERLRRGAGELGLPFSMSLDELRTRSLHCITANQLVDGGLKIVVFQDEARLGEMILTQPAKYPAEFYSRGFRLKTIGDGFRGDEISSLKTLNYLKSVRAKRNAQAAGFDEALFIGEGGGILEGATSNVFIVKDGSVCTPALGQGILPGIVRAKVLEAAGTERIRESAIAVAQLRGADEVFITNSLLGVMPVSCVDEQDYALERNSVTQSIMAAYRTLELQSAHNG